MPAAPTLGAQKRSALEGQMQWEEERGRRPDGFREVGSFEGGWKKAAAVGAARWQQLEDAMCAPGEKLFLAEIM
jgi:hypothetical protein